VTFLNKAGIKRTLNELPNGSRVVIDANRTIDLDPDVFEIIEDFTATAEQRGIRCELIGFKVSWDGASSLHLNTAPPSNVVQ
jgi:MFS superfamily sulfate permease-like transporter